MLICIMGRIEDKSFIIFISSIHPEEHTNHLSILTSIHSYQNALVALLLFIFMVLTQNSLSNLWCILREGHQTLSRRFLSSPPIPQKTFHCMGVTFERMQMLIMMKLYFIFFLVRFSQRDYVWVSQIIFMFLYFWKLVNREK